MEDRISIAHNITYLSYELDGPISKAIDMLKKIEESYPNAILDFDTRGWDDSPKLYVDDMRLETDDEFNTRIQQESIKRERALESKKRQLERLKKELGQC